MTGFRYTALRENGEEIKGIIQAPDMRSARAQLKSRDVFVTSINTDDDPAAIEKNNDVRNMLSDLMPVTVMRKIFFFRQLSVLLRSGMPLAESLRSIERLMTGRMKSIVKDILRQVTRGNRFSQALGAHPSVFPGIVCHMVRSAEASGELDIIAERIAGHMERKAELKRQTIVTMLYPSITLLFAIGLFIFLAVGVIPKFAEFIQRRGNVVPPMTQALIDVSDFAQSWGILLMIVFMMTCAAIVYSYQKPGPRRAIDRIILMIPVFGHVVHLSCMSQLCWGLSVLLRSGLTIVESLGIVKDLVGNRVVSDSIISAGSNISRGGTLEESFRHAHISPLIQQMASVGESSGSLDQIMDEAGNYFENALQVKSKVLAALMEPVAILLIGGMVGFVYIAFFSAVFAISGG
ncbi:MAG: type II secretion system F family protein [Nitrospira sp.]|nr:type II secretion system F family protein [bacterium]MBL7048314.1 type II secretion system F family protein [Nitrospira sp.]